MGTSQRDCRKSDAVGDDPAVMLWIAAASRRLTLSAAEVLGDAPVSAGNRAEWSYAVRALAVILTEIAATGILRSFQLEPTEDRKDAVSRAALQRAGEIVGMMLNADTQRN
jgi:hypothetical protein